MLLWVLRLVVSYYGGRLGAEHNSSGGRIQGCRESGMSGNLTVSAMCVAPGLLWDTAEARIHTQAPDGS